MSIAIYLSLQSIPAPELQLELLQRAIARTNAAIETDERAQANLRQKLLAVESGLTWMRTRQIARQKELARHLARRQCTPPQPQPSTP